MPEYRRSFAQILSEHVDSPYDPEHRGFIERIASALYERYEDLPPIEEWPQSVRFFFACYDLNFQVMNGGFAQAAYNAPELFPIAKEAFEHLGLREAAGLCQEALSFLSSEHAEHQEKGFTGAESLQDVFDHFAESKMGELDERIPEEFWADDKLQELAQRHRSEFASMDDLT